MSLLGGGSTSDIPQSILDDLAKLDINKITPMDALSKLYELSVRAKLLK